MYRWIVPLLMGIAMTNANAQNAPHTPQPGSAERKAILDAARAPAEKDLDKPVRFVVDKLNVLDGWAFLSAEMRGDDGQPIRYAGTRYAEAAEQGFKSKRYAALLQREHDTWQVRAFRVGPTDLAWAGWDAEYGAPSKVLPESARTESTP